MDRRIEIEVGALAVAQLRLIEDGGDPARLAVRLLLDYAGRCDRDGDELRLAAVDLLASAPADERQSDADRGDLAEARCVLAMPDLVKLCERRGARLGIGPGWVRIAWEAVERILVIAPQAVITQVKQKFGGLDINISGGTDPGQNRLVTDVVADARRKAFETCELCGLTGSPRSDRRYVETLCDTHARRTT